MAEWTEDRRRMALMFMLRLIAAGACLVAAAVPYAVASWRWGWGYADALSYFTTPGWPLVTVAVAGLTAGIMARAVQQARDFNGLTWPVLASGVSGAVGVAMAS